VGRARPRVAAVTNSRQHSAVPDADGAAFCVPTLLSGFEHFCVASVRDGGDFVVYPMDGRQGTASRRPLQTSTPVCVC